MIAAEIPGRRLRRADRRDQLLDVAADLVVERGAGALTMEGLAARAEVSKALPYAHFDNADAVLVELYRREVARIGTRITEVVADAHDEETRLRSAVHAYFDVVAERGAILSILTGPGSMVPYLSDGGKRRNNRFFADLLQRHLGVTAGRAPLVAAVLLGALSGAVDAWANCEAKRSAAESSVVEITLHLAR